MPDQRRRRVAVSLSAALLAAGCATPSQHPVPATAPQRWSGRLALSVADEPPQQFHAAFDLSGSASAGRLELTSPLGSTLAILQWEPGLVQLQQGQNVRHFASLETVTQAVTGAAFPVQVLFSWLAGEPRNVDGWEVNLSQLDSGRLQAQRHSPAPAAQLRLILDTP